MLIQNITDQLKGSVFLNIEMLYMIDQVGFKIKCSKFNNSNNNRFKQSMQDN